ncbi:phosphotransferase enzyme family protein [Trichophyton equinum CBS 127.97]|uniref:Altered inheritance of mitochondria protein 9, mitochondrial n=1 Tax=Trichophyton equinum (strain ATCC MYA-4606 / CBS 127.97) TaxID=559882 RepID=F2PKM7_TRIEC|nr:phosphotransferase enzyme family protein [Trichophyton equinum CBS 127.97]
MGLSIGPDPLMLCRRILGKKKLGITIIHRHSFHSLTTSRCRQKSNALFSYTSGRWLDDEESQLRKRYVEFNVDALKHCASQATGSVCVKLNKLPEGLHNKVFSLQMENGREVIARIPNPNAGNSRIVVSGEVATLEFLHNILDIPVPKVLAWSSSALQSNAVGTEFILMDRVKGVQLSEVWDDMSERQRFNLVKNVVEIEKRLVDIPLSGYGGLYHREILVDNDSSFFEAISPGQMPGKEDDISKFVIGPTPERAFYTGEGEEPLNGRGPWKSAVEYLTAIAKREISTIQEFNKTNTDGLSSYLRPANTSVSSSLHVRLLEQFISVLPYIIPPLELLKPTLMHQDLHFDNIFVNKTDPSEISGIIDWQGTYISPIFLQARFPSIFDCDDLYPWGAIQPALPTDFHTLTLEEKRLAEKSLDRLRLKKFYELASRKMNPLLVKAMDSMRNDEYPTSFIFYIVQQSALDGPIPLRELLIQVYEQWSELTGRNGETPPCPISFTEI